MNTRELSIKHPEAFAALPSAYQNDDCLEFWHEDGVLLAKAKPGQEKVVGFWTTAFIHNKWRDVTSSKAKAKGYFG